MTLKEITKDILYEGVSTNEINNAINGHKYVVINYQGTDNTHTSNRMIQPVAFGLTTSGNEVLRAFEPFGDTKTSVPRWKYFRVDRISSWRDTNKTFNEPAELFNPDDDKTMSVVYNIAKFEDEDDIKQPPMSGPKKKSDEKQNIYKTETERNMEKLRKQLKNPLTISDFKVENAFNGIDKSKQNSGPKTKQDMKKGTDNVYTNDYNYNVFDDSLSASGSKKKRNANYYYQKRNNGKFAKGYVTYYDPIDDTNEINSYLNQDNGNSEELEKLRKKLGDTTNPILFRDLQNRLKKK